MNLANSPIQPNLAALEGARGSIDAALARLDQLGDLPYRFAPERTLALHQRRAELYLWRRRPQAALAEALRGLDAVTGTWHARFAGELACLGARSIGDLVDRAGARHDNAALEASHRQARLLSDRVSGLAHDPFTPAPLQVTAIAERALWHAERSRADGSPRPACWADAVRAWQGLGRPYQVAYCQWRNAEALLAVGGRVAEAGESVRAAQTIATVLGAGPLRTEVEALARRARIALATPSDNLPVDPTPVAAPHGLTEREVAVLRLLIAGHTNREIGEHLFMSPKTASVHVSNILRKLAVRDRVAAAAAAVRLGLAEPTADDR